MDTKNTTEILDVIGTLALAIKEAREDGSIDYWDAPKFLKLLPAAHKAIDGMNLVVQEVKDLDLQEAQDLTAKLVEVMTALLDAVLTE